MEQPPRTLSRALVWAVGCAALTALVWRMCVQPVDFGYLRHLGIADEMARSGDWVVLRLVDRIYVNKPPLFVWLMAGPIALLGEAPSWVPHVPDLLALGIYLVCVHRLGAALYGHGEPALAALLVFATSWETFNQISSRRLDPLFSALLTGAFTAFYLATVVARDRRAQQWRLALAWILVGLATLTKGPLAVVFFALVALPFAAWTGTFRRWVGPGSLAGLAALAALATTWPTLLVSHLGFDESLRAVQGANLSTRKGDLLLYFRSLPVQELPWSVFLPTAVAAVLQRQVRLASSGLRFAALWFGVLFVALHVTETRHPRYLLPALPAFSLLLLSLWYAPGGAPTLLAGVPRHLLRATTGALLLVLAVLGTVAGAGFLVFERDPLLGRVLGPERWIAGPVAWATAFGAVVALRGFRTDSPSSRGPIPLALLLLGVLTVMSLVAAADLRAQDRIPEARLALAPITAGGSAAVLGLDEEQRQMARLLTRRQVPVFRDTPALVAWIQAQPPGELHVLTDAAGHDTLAGEPSLNVQIDRRFELAQERILLLRVRSRS